MTKDANQRGPETGKHPDHFLAEWREYRGLTVRGLAAMVSVSHSKISRIETGESELRPSFAKKIARFFNIPLAALFTVNPQGEGRKAAEMIDILMSLDPAKQDMALSMLRGLANSDGDKRAG